VVTRVEAESVLRLEWPFLILSPRSFLIAKAAIVIAW